MKVNHETRVFYLLAALIILSVIYLFAVSFFEIPKENVTFVGTIVGFVSGTLITSIVNYYVGSSPKVKSKQSQATGTTTAEFTAHVTTEPIEPPKETANE